MKKYVCILCGIAALCCCACKRRIVLSDVDASIVLTPLQHAQLQNDLGDVVDAVELTEIADDKRTYTSVVTKMVLDRNKNMYMLDDRGNLVAIKPDGTFLTTVARRGRAGNEYLNISDIAISDREFMILDGSKVKCFDLADLSQVRIIDIPVNVPCDALAPDGMDGIYLYSAFPRDYEDTRTDNDFLLYRVSSDGELVAEYVKREDNTVSMNNISQASIGEYILRPQSSNHVFYRLTEDGIVPEYKIDFGEKNIPHRYFFDSADEDLGTYIMSPYYKLPMELHETSSHVFFRVAGPQARETSIVYDKRSKKGIRWESEPCDMQMQILASDGEWFYAVMPELPETDELHGPFFRYVHNALQKQGMSEAEHSYIVKIQFGRL